MDLLPIQATKPSSPMPVAPTSEGEQDFADLIDALLVGLTAVGADRTAHDGEKVGGDSDEGDGGDPGSWQEAPETTRVTATVIPVPPTPTRSPAVPPIVSGGEMPRVSGPEALVDATPEPPAPPDHTPRVAPVTAAGPELAVDVVPVAIADVRVTPVADSSSSDAGQSVGDRGATPDLTENRRLEPSTPIPLSRPPLPIPRKETDVSSGESFSTRFTDIESATADPVPAAPKDLGPLQTTDVDPLEPHRSGGNDPMPSVDLNRSPPPRLPDLAPAGINREAMADLVDRLAEWADRVETAGRSDAISLRLADADGDLLVRLALRDGRLELNVTRPGGESLPWLLDQLGDALSERGFDMAEREKRPGREEDGRERSGAGRPRPRPHERQHDGILM